MRTFFSFLTMLANLAVCCIGVFGCVVGLLGVLLGIRGDCLIPLAGFITVALVVGSIVYFAVKG